MVNGFSASSSVSVRRFYEMSAQSFADFDFIKTTYDISLDSHSRSPLGQPLRRHDTQTRPKKKGSEGKARQVNGFGYRR